MSSSHFPWRYPISRIDSMTHAARQTRNGLAAERDRSRTPSEPFPARPTTATIPAPITPDSLDLRRRSNAVRLAATDRILPELETQIGAGAYRRRRTDGSGDALYSLLCQVVEERNAGQSPAERRLYEVEMVAVFRDLDSSGIGRPADADLECLETRYEGEANAAQCERRRRLAAGEPETAEMHEAEANKLALHISHAIDLFRARQRRARELRKAANQQQAVTLRMER